MVRDKTASRRDFVFYSGRIIRLLEAAYADRKSWTLSP